MTYKSTPLGINLFLFLIGKKKLIPYFSLRQNGGTAYKLNRKSKPMTTLFASNLTIRN